MRTITPTSTLFDLAHRDPYRMLREMAATEPFQTAMADATAFRPRFDVRETHDAYVFEADVPGVREQDVEVTMTGNRLDVRVEREMEERRDGDRWHTMERMAGECTRTFTLPEACTTSDVTADMKNGVLTVTVPKKPAQQARRVEIGTQARATKPETTAQAQPRAK